MTDEKTTRSTRSPVIVHATQADYWFAAGPAKWRKCRVPFKCYGLGGSQPSNQCGHEIEKGEEYLDTGELTDPPFGTFRMCAACAGKPSETLKPGPSS